VNRADTRARVSYCAILRVALLTQQQLEPLEIAADFALATW